jgi:hypothetical protein
MGVTKRAFISAFSEEEQAQFDSGGLKPSVKPSGHLSQEVAIGVFLSFIDCCC